MSIFQPLLVLHSAGPSVGARIQAALGAPVDLAGTAEVVLEGMLVDDGGSIEYYDNTRYSQASAEGRSYTRRF